MMALTSQSMTHGEYVARYTPFGPLVAHPPAASDDYRRITVDPCTPTIGAEIGGVQLSGSLDEETLDEIRRAQRDWKVLFFHDQQITRQDHREFATRWGELEAHPFFKYVQPGQTDVNVTTLAKDMSTAGVENNWHNDVSWSVLPSHAAVLRASEVPPLGGDTLWSDTAAAYDTLPEDLRDQLDSLDAEHDWIDTFGAKMPQDAIDVLRPHLPPVTHPVVRVIPETGRKVLFVNVVFTQRILGVSEEESTELLRRIYTHIARSECQVRLRWKPDTIAFWDNRTCQHYASSDYFPNRRVMDRISIAGAPTVGINGREGGPLA